MNFAALLAAPGVSLLAVFPLEIVFHAQRDQKFNGVVFFTIGRLQVDVVRFLVGENCVPFSLFNLPCFSAYRVLMFTGAIATTFNIAIAYFLVREIDVESGRAREYEVKVLLPPPPPPPFSFILPIRPHQVTNPWTIFKEVAGSGRFWRFVALIFLLVGVRLIYRHMDATFPKYMLREFGPQAPYGTPLPPHPSLVLCIEHSHLDSFTQARFLGSIHF